VSSGSGLCRRDGAVSDVKQEGVVGCYDKERVVGYEVRGEGCWL